MSNFDSTKNRSKNKALPGKKSSKTPKKSNPENGVKTDAKARWSFIQSNLGSAASEWTELDQKPPEKSPEEVQFEKVKNMIENLKDKLNEF